MCVDRGRVAGHACLFFLGWLVFWVEGKWMYIRGKSIFSRACV